jgi:hypothetical protein
MITRFRVKQAFDAKLATSRRREKFDAGELLMLVNGAESPAQARFVRINGLRPGGGLECQYIVASNEFKEKTEIAAQIQ